MARRFPRAKRDRQANVRLTSDELRRLVRVASARGLTVGEFLRGAALAVVASAERREAKAKKEDAA